MFKKIISTVLCLFLLMAISACAKSKENVEPDTNVDLGYWQGEWYGWWTTTDGTGVYKDMSDKGICFDAYAYIETYEDNTGYVYIWDTETSKGFPLAKADVSFSEDKMTSTTGYFFCSDEWLEQFNVSSSPLNNNWEVCPKESSVADIDHMIEIKGTYESSDGNFNYYFYLRPWGMMWDDVKANNSSNHIYSDMMPLYYDNWYLSLIYINENLPDSFSKGIDIINDYLNNASEEPANTETNTNTNVSSLGDKESATGEVSKDKLLEVLPFLQANGGRNYNTTYDEIAEKFGAHGVKTDSWDDYIIYRWWCDDENDIQVTFQIKDGIEYWNVTAWNGLK